MNPKDKLKQILRAMKGESIDFSGFDNAVKDLRKQLEDKIAVPTLDKVNSELDKFNKKLDFTPLVNEFDKLKDTITNRDLSYRDELTDKLEKLRSELSDARGSNKDSVAGLIESIKVLQTQIDNLPPPTEVPDFATQIKDTEDRLNTLIEAKTDTVYNDTDIRKVLKDFEERLIRFRNELNNRGGGNMNRNIAIGGNPSVLQKYTDINLKAGNNVTIVYQNNEVKKWVDITISATGGGSGSVGGVIRSINTVATSQAMGNTSGTDYVYLCTQGVNLTLPDASANTNLYTVKNISNSSVLVTTTGGQAIDNDTTIIMPIKYTSVDLISNTSNTWNIT